jgi:hypothetical protein
MKNPDSATEHTYGTVMRFRTVTGQKRQAP